MTVVPRRGRMGSAPTAGVVTVQRASRRIVQPGARLGFRAGKRCAPLWVGATRTAGGGEA